jgi:methylenetetrahydrofolate dehydrogenase (NADP+)/methenyltetrahydrofolate cyclohydrolase
MSKLLDGKACSAAMREGLRGDVEVFKAATGRAPGLAVILASDDPASRLYVSKKTKACTEVGIRSSLHVYSEKCSWHGCRSPEDFVRMVLTQSGFIDDKGTDGVLVQLPVAGVSDPKPLFDLIPVDKDVDVFHPANVGKLMQGRPRFKPCTPAGIMHLLAYHGIDVAGQDVCIINDSNIVGRPLAMMLTDAGATVTICHKRTPKQYLKYICGLSRIVVVGVGIPDFLTTDMVCQGAIVVDVGINRLEDGKVVGDVHPDVSQVAQWISPVPGGVGPMTVTMLLSNTIQAAMKRAGLFYSEEPWG